jgi:hypothetical protein
MEDHGRNIFVDYREALYPLQLKRPTSSSVVIYKTPKKRKPSKPKGQVKREKIEKSIADLEKERDALQTEVSKLKEIIKELRITVDILV